MVELEKKDYESYKSQIEQSIKVHEMALLTDRNTLKLLEEKIKECPIETTSEDETKNTK